MQVVGVKRKSMAESSFQVGAGTVSFSVGFRAAGAGAAEVLRFQNEKGNISAWYLLLLIQIHVCDKTVTGGAPSGYPPEPLTFNGSWKRSQAQINGRIIFSGLAKCGFVVRRVSGEKH